MAMHLHRHVSPRSPSGARHSNYSHQHQLQSRVQQAEEAQGGDASPHCATTVSDSVQTVRTACSRVSRKCFVFVSRLHRSLVLARHFLVVAVRRHHHRRRHRRRRHRRRC